MKPIRRQYVSSALLICLFFGLSDSVFAQPARIAPKIKVIALTSPVNRGGTGSITIQTVPGATCRIVIHQKVDPGTTKDLVPKTADASGLVKWTWKVGAQTTPGSTPITVTCSASSHQATVVTSVQVR